MDARVDERFARCPFFCFYYMGTKRNRFIESTFKDERGGAGPQVAEFLAENKVQEVYAVEIGPKAQRVLEKLNIGIQRIHSGQSVRQIINMFND